MFSAQLHAVTDPALCLLSDIVYTVRIIPVTLLRSANHKTAKMYTTSQRTTKQRITSVMTRATSRKMLNQNTKSVMTCVTSLKLMGQSGMYVTWGKEGVWKCRNTINALFRSKNRLRLYPQLSARYIKVVSTSTQNKQNAPVYVWSCVICEVVLKSQHSFIHNEKLRFVGKNFRLVSCQLTSTSNKIQLVFFS